MDKINLDSPLVSIIRQQIAQSEASLISFRQFMELCLYAPEYGYYTGTRSKVGKNGDFYTSSAIGGLFGEMLACFIAERIKVLAAAGYEVVEWGGGTGQMAKQILDKIRNDFPDLYGSIRYIVIERSEYHRSLQLDLLQEHRKNIIFWTPEEWKENGKRRHTFIFSNELLDAFPVFRVRQKSGQLYEIYVGWDEAMEVFYECEVICKTQSILEYLEHEGIELREGQWAEINVGAEQWIREIADWMEQGDLVTIDYGDVAAEIYAEHRMQGTLLCYKDHRAYDNPYIHVGEQDITAHVNFSACIRAGMESGIQEWSLQTQREFLVEAGILSLLQNDDSRDPFSKTAKRNRAIRQLLLSDQMSELFKVLIQTKKVDSSSV
ncbi:MAG: hypothetical protein JWM44_356 [Bacilli bacterium]|nr:hypothetical protein [Bacilli bacterium]